MWITIMMLACQNTEKTSPDTKQAQPTSTQNNQAKDIPKKKSKTSADEKSMFSGDPKLTPLNVSRYDPKQLPFIRNEIFARHGRAFKTPKFAKHFAAKGWYTIDPNYNDSKLTQNDKKNVALIKSFEGTNNKQFLALGELWFEGEDYDKNRLLIPMNDKEINIHRGDDMYHTDPSSFAYVLQGEWFITFSGTLKRQKGSYTLWRYDKKKGVITERHEQKGAL